jgi:hypothetical protein
VCCPRGIRHIFADLSEQPAHVPGPWIPGGTLEFMAEIYQRHNSDIVLYVLPNFPLLQPLGATACTPNIRVGIFHQ